MGREIVVKLAEDVYSLLAELSVHEGVTVEDWAAEAVESQVRAEVTSGTNGVSDAENAGRRAIARFERHFGELDLGHPTSMDNDDIDADLARELEQDQEG